MTDNLSSIATAEGGFCANHQIDELGPFLTAHSISQRTTDAPTTTLATTAPNSPYLSDPINSDIPTTKNLYVDDVNGQDYNSGTTLDAPKKTIQNAIDQADSGTTIFVLNGEYNNPNFNQIQSGNPINKNNGPAVEIKDKTDLVLRNYPGHIPKIAFDGEAGIIISGASNNVEIRGLEIEGPCNHVTEGEAKNNRLTDPKDAYFNNVGININNEVHHVRITNNKIHDASGSGIKSTGNDYLSILNNEIYENTKCSSTGGSGVLIDSPVSIDNARPLTVKIGVINNQITDNFNQVPFYDSNLDNTFYIINNNIIPPRINYGSSLNPSDDGFIIDGSGVKITSNPMTGGDSSDYPSGAVQISNNEIIRNGIAGIEVEDIDRVAITDNIIAWNGMTSKDPATSDRPNSAGVKITNSEQIKLADNQVFVYHSDDFGYEFDNDDEGGITANSIDISDSNTNNKLCGGIISTIMHDYVSVEGGNCAEDQEFSLQAFLTEHFLERTTLAPTTGRFTVKRKLVLLFLNLNFSIKWPHCVRFGQTRAHLIPYRKPYKMSPCLPEKDTMRSFYRKVKVQK